MPIEQRLTLDQIEGVRLHTEHLILVCQNTVAKLRTVPKKKRPIYLENEIAYWVHAEKALRWSLGIANQRKPTCEGRPDGDIRKTSGSNVEGC
jgi:hypothetical protein